MFFFTKLCPFFELEFSKCSYSRALAPACGALVFTESSRKFVRILISIKSSPCLVLGHVWSKPIKVSDFDPGVSLTNGFYAKFSKITRLFLFHMLLK